MGVFTNAQTVDTRPLFPPPTWPGYEATISLIQVYFYPFLEPSEKRKKNCRPIPWYASADLFATTTVPADNTVSLQARTCSRVTVILVGTYC